MSNLLYHLEIWGNCSRGQVTQINNQMISIAIKLSNKKIGLTNEAYLKEMNWLSFKQLHINTMNKFTHKLLNPKNTNHHYLTYKLIKHRNICRRTDNKPGPMKHIHSNDIYILRSLIYNMKMNYLQLHRNLTTINKCHIFKIMVQTGGYVQQHLIMNWPPMLY